MPYLLNYRTGQIKKLEKVIETVAKDFKKYSYHEFVDGVCSPTKEKCIEIALNHYNEIIVSHKKRIEDVEKLIEKIKIYE